ncbi:hypothetical protein WMY93_008625 [Mugilogobius chulae]|uniref:E3 ubiquitin-protein ligase RNF14 n=1 Tax=Mugilogobius chulae TaxID=88201 RepID=A0AAW0PS97_9GOBI
MSDDKEAQEDELLALASIYDEEEFHRAEGAQGGEVQVCVELPPDFRVVTKGDKQTEYNVCFLPPLVLNFEFPEDYPSTSPPQFTLSSKWVTRAQMSALCRRLDELWEENQGCVILFTWIQFLKEEAVDFLCIKSPLEVHRAKSISDRKKTEPEKREEKSSDVKPLSDLSSSAAASCCVSPLDPRAVALSDPRLDLLPQLLDHDEAQRQRLFDGKVFSCGICFSEKLGAACLCFKECQHVYCNACMSEYFQIQIKDGNVQCLNCPEPKCSSVATPLQVKHLVGEELFARYDRLLLQSTLDLMADVVYCPECQELRDLRDEYLAASADGKKFMELRFGKKVIQRAVEESFSREWLSENCKSCPRCGTNIQKVDGCNKMTCTSCKQYFCWLCMGVLSRGNPYSHFNNPQSPCFNQLFFGVDPDDGDEFFSDEDD